MNSPADRLLFTIPSLRGGGAERVFAIVAGGLSEIGFDVHLALAQREGPWLERLPKSVVVHDLKAPRVRQAAWPLWRLVRKLQPAAVFSTITHMNKMVGLLRSGFPTNTRVLLRESTSRYLERRFVSHRLGPLHRAAYRAADKVICLSEGMREAAHREYGISWSRLVRIYNPLDNTSPVDQFPEAPSLGNPGILSIGRMDDSKGFDRILAAFPACLKRYPGATLTLLGDGPHREALKRQAAALGIADRVSMPGFERRVSRQLKACDLFVLASRFEGLPNVLLEAVDAECPVAVVEHPGGTREVMELLGQADRITTDLSEWRPAWFERPAAAVRQTALEHFGLSTIVQQYAALVHETADSPRIAA